MRAVSAEVVARATARSRHAICPVLMSIAASQRVRIHFGHAVRLGRRVYASNGDFGAAVRAMLLRALALDEAWQRGRG